MSVRGTDIDRRIAQAESTGMLHLSYCGLSRIPPRVLQMTELVRLDLGSNYLESLPPEISNFTKLEQLWVNNNPLQAVPAEIEHCRGLKVLDLRGTVITNLPKELSRPVQLLQRRLRHTAHCGVVAPVLAPDTNGRTVLSWNCGRCRLRHLVEIDTRGLTDLNPNLADALKEGGTEKLMVRSRGSRIPTPLHF